MALSCYRHLCVYIVYCIASSAAAAVTSSLSLATASITGASSASVHAKLLSSEIYTSPQTAALRYLVIDISFVMETV